MIKPTIYYCFDAYCGWCYAFSKHMKSFYEAHKHAFFFEVLSGNMIPRENKHHISKTASYLQEATKIVTKNTGTTFGREYLWHIENANLSDWIIDSELPAICLTVFKTYYPERAVEFAHDIQFSLFEEGRDLCDKEAYRHLLAKYSIDTHNFYNDLENETYIKQAYNEFALVKQLGVQGFPSIFLQVTNQKLYHIANGYMNYSNLETRLLEASQKNV
jgi:putative protein-disulfide isomerase